MNHSAKVSLMCFGFAAALGSGLNCALAQDLNCVQLNRLVIEQVSNGQTRDPKGVLSNALANIKGQENDACTGLVLNNLAAIMLNTGKLIEAEGFAERAVKEFERSYSRNDPVLLRPLQIVCASQFGQGKTGRARETFQRMRSIPLERVEDQALVHGLAASMLVAEGKNREAEAEYVAALGAFKQADRANTADAGAIFEALGMLYIRQQRFDEARHVLNRSLAIFTGSRETLPGDLVTVLNLRAVLHSRLGDWSNAETDLAQGLAILDREPQVDPVAIRSLLTNYAVVLRKMHQRRKARSIEAREAACKPARLAL